MKRDFELIRKIMFAIEEHPHGRAPHIREIDGYSVEQVGYHLWLIMREKLADGADLTHGDDHSPRAYITRLTPRGHSFVEAARSDTAWNQATSAAKQAGGVAFGTFIQLVVRAAAIRVGLVQ